MAKSNTKRKVQKISQNYISGDWQTLRDEFIAEKKAGRRRESTIKDYQKHINAFFRQYPDAFETEERLQACVMDYLSRDVAPDTHNNRRLRLGTFFSWCVNEKVLSANPARRVEMAAVSFTGRPLDEGEVEKLLTAPDQTRFVGLRDYALMLLQIDTGIRPNEALQLMPFDINFPSRKVLVRGVAAKTHDTRSLPLSPRLAGVLRRLMATRPSVWDSESSEFPQAPLFCTCYGTRLSNRQWRGRVEDYAKKTGIDVSTYDLRHTFATLALKNEADPLYVQEMLGHRRLDMTRRYVHRVTAERLTRLHEKVSPIQNIFDKGKRGEGRSIDRLK